MTEKVSTMDVRARIGDMLNRVALRHDEFVLGEYERIAIVTPRVFLAQIEG